MASSVAELSRSKLSNFGHSVIIMGGHEEAGGWEAALIGTVVGCDLCKPSSGWLGKGQSLVALYDYVFSLEYVRPRFRLKMGEKELSHLSPGERGTLLLVFYVLIDKEQIPLVIDQPEENLDNQPVFEVLVPCIKQTKESRQMIIVTHNPNLAIVCDAEPIVCAVKPVTTK